MNDSTTAIEYYDIYPSQYTLNNKGAYLADQGMYSGAYKLFDEAVKMDSTYKIAIANKKLVAPKVPNSNISDYSWLADFFTSKSRKNQKGSYYKTYLFYLDESIEVNKPSASKQIPYDYAKPELLKFKQDFILMTSTLDDEGLYKKNQGGLDFDKPKKTKRRKSGNIWKEIKCKKIKF